MSDALSQTSRKGGFADTFVEVAHSNTLGLKNGEQLRLFHLAVDSNRFSHTQLVDYLRLNIGRYVFSRAELEDYLRNDKIEMVALDAVVRITCQGEAQGLGELMLYIVLEQVLNAPKVMSKIELNRVSGAAPSKCDAIHLLQAPGGKATSNIVFGTSTVIGDMQDAIDHAFDKVIQIEHNRAEECKLAESTIFTKTVDDNTAQSIRELLIPQPGSMPTYDTAYGIFLAYDLGLDPRNYSNAEYREQLDKKLQLDIQQHASYIVKKIHDHHLDTHAFYIFVLPFDDSVMDSTSIMGQLLNQGGGYNA